MRKIRSILGRLVPLAAFVVLLVAVVVLVWLRLKPKDETLKIDDTPNVVAEIRKIAEFTTACYYEDVILKDKKPSESIPGKVVNAFGSKDKPIMEDHIVMVASGNVRAGFDLSKLQEKDVVINDSVLEITLPKARVLEVIVNPTDFDIYIEDGDWSHAQVTKVEQKAMEKIKQDALKDGLLQKATELGVRRLTDLFETFGFKKVVVRVR